MQDIFIDIKSQGNNYRQKRNSVKYGVLKNHSLQNNKRYNINDISKHGTKVLL